MIEATNKIKICRDCVSCAGYNKGGISSLGRYYDEWDCFDLSGIPLPKICPVTGNIDWPKCNVRNRLGDCKMYREVRIEENRLVTFPKTKKAPWWRLRR